MDEDIVYLHSFEEDFWAYYLTLEKRLVEVSQYIEFVYELRKTYSRELLSLLQAVGSEIDVCGKSIAEYFHRDDSKLGKAPIGRWGFVLQNELPSMLSRSVSTPLGINCIPWDNWRHEKSYDKNGKEIFRLSKGKENPEWWRAYNATKHRRKSLIHKDCSEFNRATLQNVVMAMCGLYVLENTFLSYLSSKVHISRVWKSSLFDTESNSGCC